MHAVIVKSIFFICLVTVRPSAAAEEPGAYKKSVAEAAKASSESRRIDLMAPAEVEKLQSETAKNWAEAVKNISEAHLNYAKRDMLMVEMERLKQRMRITEYEFRRIVSADYQMNTEISFLQSQGMLIRPLILGRCNWKTWNALETLMERIGDADVIVQIMWEIKVEELPSSEFVSNESGSLVDRFTGGNLGELYTFVQRRDYSFRKFGPAHKYIMKVVAMISKAAELKIRELRDINQAIRLTVAKIDS